MNQVIYGMPMEKYAALPHTNFSKLKLLAKSPAHFRHGLVEEREDTDALKLGRGVDLAVFEPERFGFLCTVAPDVDRRTKAGKEEWAKFCAANDGKEILKADEWADCLALQKAILSDATAKRYVTGGKSQVTLLWEHALLDNYSLPLKGRVDFETEDFLVDLKTTRDASPQGFMRQAWNYEYWIQASMYLDGYEAITGKRKKFALVAAEKAAPHVVQVYLVPDALLAMGREEYVRRLAVLASCRIDSRWPGYAEGELTLEVPRWAVPVLEESAHVE